MLFATKSFANKKFIPVTSLSAGGSACVSGLLPMRRSVTFRNILCNIIFSVFFKAPVYISTTEDQHTFSPMRVNMNQ